MDLAIDVRVGTACLQMGLIEDFVGCDDGGHAGVDKRKGVDPLVPGTGGEDFREALLHAGPGLLVVLLYAR